MAFPGKIKFFAAAFFLFLPLAIFAGGRKAVENPAPAVEAAAADQREPINGYFFFEEFCGICHDDNDRFIAILQEKLPLEERDQYPHLFNTANVYDTAGRAQYVRITDELGLDRETLEVPLLILGGRVYQGYDSISANIREAYLTAAEDLYVYHRPYSPKTRKTGANLFDDYSIQSDHVTLVYFHRLVCPDCAQINPIIDALPSTVTVNGKERPLDIIRINTRAGNNGERVAAFFEAWQVPDADRQVPIVFFAGSYLSGPDAIKAQLQQRLGEEPGSWKLIPEKK